MGVLVWVGGCECACVGGWVGVGGWVLVHACMCIHVCMHECVQACMGVFALACACVGACWSLARSLTLLICYLLCNCEGWGPVTVHACPSDTHCT